MVNATMMASGYEYLMTHRVSAIGRRAGHTSPNLASGNQRMRQDEECGRTRMRLARRRRVSSAVDPPRGASLLVTIELAGPVWASSSPQTRSLRGGPGTVVRPFSRG